MMPIINILPSTQTNSAKEDGELTQENYTPSEMFQDLKNQRTTRCFALRNIDKEITVTIWQLGQSYFLLSQNHQQVKQF